MSITKFDDFLVIYVDGDACPVKDEVFRVAARHKLLTRVVANTWLRLPASPLIELSVVTEGLDAADNWIVENISTGDIAITSDIPLAARCLWPRRRPRWSSRPRPRRSASRWTSRIQALASGTRWCCCAMSRRRTSLGRSPRRCGCRRGRFRDAQRAAETHQTHQI